MKNVATSGLMWAVSLSILAAQGPALSFDFDSLLRNYLGSKTEASASPDQALIKSNINTRQAQLESQIDAGVSSGQLTPQEETDLRAELNRVAAVEGNYLADGSFSPAETQQMVDDLTQVTRRLNTYLTNTTTTTSALANVYQPGGMRRGFHRYGGSGTGDAVSSNQALIKSNIDTRRAQLDGSIESGIISGELSAAESTSLRARLNDIAVTEERYLADGRLSYREQGDLTASIEKLNADLQVALTNSERVQRWNRGRGSYRNDRGYSARIDSRQTYIRDRIQRGVTSGQLTARESARLLRMDSRITELEARLKVSGNRLTYSEQTKVLNELDQLADQLNRELNDKNIR